MCGDLLLLMMAHLDTKCRCQAGDFAPYGGSTSPGTVEIADIDSIIDDQIPYSGYCGLALTCGYSYSRHVAHVTHPSAVREPPAGRLRTAENYVRDAPGEPHPLLGGIIPICLNTKGKMIIHTLTT